MQATIIQELELPRLPSASGVEVVGATAYIIGDDSPLLYCLDAHTLAPGAPITLFETADFGSGRIPKGIKPDLEGLTALPSAPGQTSLLVLGSGATPAREKGFWVTLPTDATLAATVEPLSLSALYAVLRAALPAGLVLNLEAVAATTTELLLFQRTVGSTIGNLLFRLPLEPVLSLLRYGRGAVPTVGRQFYQLPLLDGKPAGFSGASTFEDLLFITASVEDTADALADGSVLGSFVGVLNISEPLEDAAVLPLARLELPGGRPYRGKVEGVAVRRVLGPGRYELLLVTDDDTGGSTAVVAELLL